jgi:hypothetical protein
MSGFFSFIHFHWIREIEKPLKPILFRKFTPPFNLNSTSKQKNALVDVVG